MADSLFILTFGKHKGQPIEDVPISYLNWLCEQDWFCTEHPGGIKAIEQEMKFRERFSDGDEPEEDRNWNRRASSPMPPLQSMQSSPTIPLSRQQESGEDCEALRAGYGKTRR